MKKVYIIHGWEGYPEENWLPWLKLELESGGFEVNVPQMPEALQIFVLEELLKMTK